MTQMQLVKESEHVPRQVNCHLHATNRSDRGLSIANAQIVSSKADLLNWFESGTGDDASITAKHTVRASRKITEHAAFGGTSASQRTRV